MTQQEFIYQYQQKVNEIWSNMSVDEYGGVYMNAQNQKIKYENLKYLNKDGKSFIYDSSSQKLYDQMFNYYQDGRYYNPWGQLVQDVEDPNIIDGSFREITDEPTVNQPETPKKRKYKATRGPKLKEKPQPEAPVEDVKVAEQVAKEPAPKPKSKPKPKPKSAKVPKTKVLPKKTLSGGGKIALGIGFIAASVAGATVVAEGIENKKGNKNKKAHSLNRTTNSQEYDNSYAQQMAADISSYRYGKHMTGFVNH